MIAHNLMTLRLIIGDDIGDAGICAGSSLPGFEACHEMRCSQAILFVKFSEARKLKVLRWLA